MGICFRIDGKNRKAFCNRQISTRRESVSMAFRETETPECILAIHRLSCDIKASDDAIRCMFKR